MNEITLPTKGEDVPGLFFLASLVMSYPDDNFRGNICMWLDDDAVRNAFIRICSDSGSALLGYLDEISQDDGAVRDLRALYVDVFERSQPSNSLYETEYGRGRSMAKGQELLAVTSFYKAFGFDIGSAEMAGEMVDHLGVELEFYGLLCLKAQALMQDGDQSGVDIVNAGRRRFLELHLGGFASALLAREGMAVSSFYFHAVKCVDALVSSECLRFDVVQRTLEWHEDILSGESEITCGSVGCLSGNPSLSE